MTPVSTFIITMRLGGLMIRIDSKKVNEIFKQIVDKAVSIEGQYLDIWDVPCKGNAKKRKEY